MKKLLLLGAFCPSIFFAQQTITSIQNGNASSPLTWDCTCFPTTDDHIVINHAVAMDVNWAITAAGSITVNSSGTLLQVGLHNLLVDGVGSQYVNAGFSAFDQIAYTNGGAGTNTGHFSVTQALYIGPNSSYTNSSLLDGIDSLLTEGTFSNTGTLNAGNILNTGSFVNDGALAGDSVGNTGTFNSLNGYMYFNAFGNSGTFTMNGTGFMDVAQDFYNIGDFTTNAQIFAHQNFYNGDSLGGSANFHNNGSIEVSNNFLNGFFVDGTGNFCVANQTYNVGVMSGTFDFCDNTGGAIDLNTGTIAGTITYCQPGCFLSLDETVSATISFYPNPSEGMLFFESKEAFISASVYSMQGQKLGDFDVNGNSIDLSNLNAGSYLIQLSGKKSSVIKRISIL